MKIAVCFYGLVGSRSDKNGQGVALDPSIAYKLNYENLIKGNNVDVFIHSWSSEFKQELLDLYKPKSYKIENQKQFPLSLKITNNRDLLERINNVWSYIKKPSLIKPTVELHAKEAFRAYSRWYSNKKVLELKAQYEKTHGFKYDCVMVLRLDVGFYSKLDFAKYDMNYFYASNWNDYPTKSNNFVHNKKNHNLGRGFLDFWFFSNSRNMDELAKLYDNIEKYHVCPHRSSYQHVMTFTQDIKYTKFRWLDFEMIRRKEFDSEI